MQFSRVFAFTALVAMVSAIPIAAPDPEPLPYCIQVGSKRGCNVKREPEPEPEPEPLPYCIQVGSKRGCRVRREEEQQCK